ncbi:hypothetical protein RB195_008012 [Necator americanus]|uniref:Secreted protein n=1 Tax=Necator americanus TaxID=51031 RepID=A0ABR1BZZ9_NECAM
MILQLCPIPIAWFITIFVIVVVKDTDARLWNSCPPPLQLHSLPPHPIIIWCSWSDLEVISRRQNLSPVSNSVS